MYEIVYFYSFNLQIMRKIVILFVFYSMIIDVHSQWIPLSTDFVPNVAVTAFGSSVMTGQTSFGMFDLAVSDDYGNTWVGANLPLSTGITHLITCDSFIYACTPNGIFKSPKNALSWSAFNEGLPNGRVDKICLKNNVLLAEGVNGIYRRNIDGNSWVMVCETSPVGGIYDFDFDDDRIVLAGYNGVAESADMGLNWSVWSDYIFEWTAVALKGDTIIAASKGGVYKKLISSGTIIKISDGLIKLWNPSGYDYYGEFEMFHFVGDNIFLCGETGVYKLSNNNWYWEHTGLTYWTYALDDNGLMLFAAKGYGGIWGCSLDQLLTNTHEISVVLPSIEISPNPSCDQITITTNCLGNKNIFLSIITTNGLQLANYQITEPTTTIDVSTFSSGMYFIKITNGKLVRTKKFLKQ